MLPSEYVTIGKDYDHSLAEICYELVLKLPDVSLSRHIQALVYGSDKTRYGSLRLEVFRLLLDRLSASWFDGFMADVIRDEARKFVLNIRNTYTFVCMYDRKTFEPGMGASYKEQQAIVRDIFTIPDNAGPREIVERARKNYRSAVTRHSRATVGTWKRVYREWYEADEIKTAIAKLEKAFFFDKSQKKSGKFRFACVQALSSKGHATSKIAERLGVSESLVRRYKRRLKGENYGKLDR